MGAFNFTVLNWVSGWYYTLARATATMDNDRYLRERTDFDNNTLGFLGTLDYLNSGNTWNMRLVMDGAVIETWDHTGASPSSYSRVNLDVSAVAEGSTLVTLQAKSTTGVWAIVATSRLYKKQDHAYASFWVTLDPYYDYNNGDPESWLKAYDASLITHRESHSW